jgi:hypothetical protein
VNSIDRIGLERSLLARNLIPIWIQFRLAVADHVNSFNELGPEYLAKVENDPSDVSMLVTCTLGTTRDKGELVTVVAAISRKDEVYAIQVEIQRWLRLYGHADKKAGSPQAMRLEFKAGLGDPVTLSGSEVDGTVWLVCEGEAISPADAAAKVFAAAIRSTNTT